MNFLCPACRTPLPHAQAQGVVPCTRCGVQVDLTRLDTAPGTARLWPDLDLTGESLGEYRLTKRIAAGGMGVVYEADGPKGPCAVKVLSALLAAEPELRTRFRREAAALRAIEHPGVVRVLAEGEERGFSWYAMERVEGTDLRGRIEKGPLPAAEVEALARSLLETLAVVHQKGFVHRDIKPGNVLLAASGPKLCDFGIARFDGSSTLTESAAVLGSLRYMSPEQRLGRAEAKSDLYALGIVLHEALAKGVPGEAPLPRGVPGRLKRLIAALLMERSADRPAHAGTALAILDRRAPRPLTLGLGTAAAAAIGAGIAYLVSAVTPDAPRNLAPVDEPAKVVQKKDPVEPKQQALNPLAQQALANTDNAPASPQAPPDEKQAMAGPNKELAPQSDKGNAAAKPLPPKVLPANTALLGGLGTKGTKARGKELTPEEEQDALLRAKLGPKYDAYMKARKPKAAKADDDAKAPKGKPSLKMDLKGTEPPLEAPVEKAPIEKAAPQKVVPNPAPAQAAQPATGADNAPQPSAPTKPAPVKKGYFKPKDQGSMPSSDSLPSK
jgi:serine/threonine-protein kinase